ncbi:FK506-binding protein [Artemisia annua]|uniref:peptidylprolyl isomerase n=1 Tax=Artemisia annua TaxID=35608 RepID=A0A2U1Q6Q9_ARTAN|nr:FK506-binding protein [Artemisia annua]
MATTLVSHISIKCSSSISTPSNKHHQAIKPCCSKPITNNYIQHLSKPTESSAFSRREAIRFGLCLNFFDNLLPASAAAESNTATAAACEFTVADSGLAFCDKVVGYGSQAEKGQLIKAHYVGKLVSGKVFDSSYNRGKPLTFRIGVGEVIKGWDQGILGGDGVPPMLAGGKRTLKLPPQLGYGMRGAGCKGGSCIIPPDSVLLFDVEFIGKA